MDERDPIKSDRQIANGYCACGCGQRTQIAKQTRPHLGHVRGEPVRFVIGHGTRGRKLALERVHERDVSLGPLSYVMDLEIEGSSMAG
jgi:hypothetical protein